MRGGDVKNFLERGAEFELTLVVKMMRRTVLLALSVALTSVPHASGFAPSAFNGAAVTFEILNRNAASSSLRPVLRKSPAVLQPRMMVEPSHVEAFVTHAPLVSDSLQHITSNVASLAGDFHAHSSAFLELAEARVKEIPLDEVASLAPTDETLERMIKAVDIGPGSESLQRFLSQITNTPGLRQVLQVILPPVSVVATGVIEAALPTYMSVLDVVSKTGGHEGLLPEGIDVTMKAVQRLAAQGEILRAFKVLQVWIFPLLVVLWLLALWMMIIQEHE